MYYNIIYKSIYVLYVLEESLVKQLQNVANNMEGHRRIMDNFTNKKNLLKHEEEKIGYEIRGKNKLAYYIIFSLHSLYLFAIKFINWNYDCSYTSRMSVSKY